MMLSSFDSVIKSCTISHTKIFNRMADCCNKERQHRSKTLSSHKATVTDDVSNLGYTSVTFVDLGVEVYGTYYCDLLCHNSCRLSYVMSLTSLYLRKQCLSI